MTHVEAIYENGVLRPLANLGLRERQHVRLSVEPIVGKDRQAEWRDSFERIEKLHEAIIARVGVLSDSTAIIAQDRMRDA